MSNRLYVVFFCILTILLSSCATPNLKKYDDPNDVCGNDRRSIIAAKETEFQKRVQKAVAGALIGGFGTIIVSKVQGKDVDVRNVLIASVIGGLSGYSIAYLQEKQKQAQTRTQLLNSIDHDAKQEVGRLTGTAKAVRNLRACRSKEIARIGDLYRAKAISKDFAYARLAEIEDQIAVDNRLITDALDGVSDRVNSYVDASQATAQLNEDLTAVVAKAEPKQKTKSSSSSSSKTIPRNVSKSQQQLEQIEENDILARQELADDVNSLKILLG